MPDLPPPPATLDGVSLFLDFDGTLVDLAPRPDAVVVTAGLLDRLERLATRMPERVAIVSGRSLAQLDAMLGDYAARVAVAGSHGAERRLAGAAADGVDRPSGLDDAGAALERFAAENGLIYEEKSFGAALHYRADPSQEGGAAALAEELAAAHRLVLQRGKMMVELRAPGTKGLAVRALMAEAAMAGTRPLFFGDDVTDEDGFEAAAALGGAGVLVGPARPTAASHALSDPAALLDWMDAAMGEGE